MSVVLINIAAGNINNLLVNFNRIKIYRSTTGRTGVYSELTDATTRIPLEVGVTSYQYYDTAGDDTYYYKRSYFHSTTNLESELSDPVQGTNDPAFDIISVSELKTNYLFGIDLTDDNGVPYPDSMFEWYIKSAVSWVEHRLDLPLRPKSIADERHDYYKQDYESYIYIHLKEYPVTAVTKVQMVLPGDTIVQDFDTSWFQLRKDSGVLHIVPGTGGASTILFGSGGAWLPFYRNANQWVPDVFRVTYTAGFEEGQFPDDIRDVVGKVAAFGPLHIAGDLLGGAGIASQSLSIDGLSQSYNTTSSATNSGYGSRILAYNRDIKEQIPTLRKYYKGNAMVVG
jgi:hypothetical protein